MGDVLKKGTRNMGSIEYTQRSDGKFNKWELLWDSYIYNHEEFFFHWDAGINDKDKTWVISGVFDYEIVIND